MTAAAKEHLTGNERLVLTSGGGDSTRFFQHMIELSDTTEPRVLIDLSAAPHRQAFDEQRSQLYDYFVQSAGVTPRWLQPEFDRKLSPESTRSELAETDVLYVDNGNARRFADAWPWWFRRVVAERAQEGSLVGAGTGAGALLWFSRGHSNARRHEILPGERWNYTLIKGLGVIPAWATTHWDQEDELGRQRRKTFKSTLSSHRKDWHTAIGLDSAAILVCNNGLLEVAQSRTTPSPAAHVYRAGRSAQPVAYHHNEPFEL